MVLNLSDVKIAVIGLGYVGLPLAVEFGKKFPTLGFDIDKHRIEALQKGEDVTNEVSSGELLGVLNANEDKSSLTFSNNISELYSCNVFIVTVPTPIDSQNQPDLTPLLRASETVGNVLKAGDTVIYESTVFFGLTEEICVPELEKYSGLKFNKDFFVGYSPERINPGDTTRRLPDIKKVTAGSTPEAADFIDQLYASIITAGTYKASSIQVAEAAKVIENTQRDVNIALINELAKIFKLAEIDTVEVLEAAGTKWNFLPFRPGLVGGHCIGVDPYYLTYKSLQLGYHPEVILAGRRINDNMGAYIAGEILKLMTKRRIQVVDSRVLVMGLTFKENCPDIRNTRVTDIINELNDIDLQVDVYDPWLEPGAVSPEGFNLINEPEIGQYDAIILAVAHDQIKAMGIDKIRTFAKATHVIYDVKSIFPKDQVDGRL